MSGIFRAEARTALVENFFRADDVVRWSHTPSEAKASHQYDSLRHGLKSRALNQSASTPFQVR